jgi:hypothetical protein
MFRGTVAALLLFFSYNISFATDFVAPKPTIVVTDGVKVIEPGKAVPIGEIVDISISKQETVPYLEGVSFEWKVLERDSAGNSKEVKFRTATPQSIYYAAGLRDKKQQVLCAITYLYIVRENKDDTRSKILEVGTKSVLVYTEITIGKVVPNPVDPVVPDPAAPTFPDGKYKLSKTSYDLMFAKVKEADRVKAAKALASSFRGMASSIKAGAISQPAQILTTTTTSNQNALKDAGVNKDSVKDFFVGLQDVIYNLYDSDKLVTAEDFATAWFEIAAGLEGVK